MNSKLNSVRLYFNLANVNLIASETQVILRVLANDRLLRQLFYSLTWVVRGNKPESLISPGAPLL